MKICGRHKGAKIGILILSSLIVLSGIQFLFGDNIRADAEVIPSVNIETNFQSSGSEGAVKIQGNKISFGNPDNIPRSDFVSTSRISTDFSRSFYLSGTITDTKAADGFTLTFQPNSNFAYDGNNASGTGLCIYKTAEGQTYGKNSLVTEIDTYDSSIGLGSDVDVRNLLESKGEDVSKGIAPHMGLSTIDSGGVEHLKDVTLVETGDPTETPAAGESIWYNNAGSYTISIKWTITDYNTGKGTYSVIYKGYGKSKTVEYKNFDPAQLFGADKKAYLTFTGSVDLNDNSGNQCDKAWSFTYDRFLYQDEDLQQNIVYYSMKKDKDGKLVRDYPIDNVKTFARPGSIVRAYYSVENAEETKNIISTMAISQLQFGGTDIGSSGDVTYIPGSRKTFVLHGADLETGVISDEKNIADNAGGTIIGDYFDITIPSSNKDRPAKGFASIDLQIGEKAPEGTISSSQLIGSKGMSQLQSEVTTAKVKKLSPGKIALLSSKTIDGKSPSKADIFKFTLSDKNGRVLQTKTNSGKNVMFDSLSFNQSGTFTYYIKEVNLGKEAMFYDKTVYKAVVKVTKGFDRFVPAVTYYKNGVKYSGIPSFDNHKGKPHLVIKETSDYDGKALKGGEIITFKITVQNTGDAKALGLRLREYMPDFTGFYSVKSPGQYGVINGKEHVSWFISTINVGEKRTFSYRVRADYCLPANYSVINNLMYEITGKTSGVSTNDAKDPANTLNPNWNAKPDYSHGSYVLSGDGKATNPWPNNETVATGDDAMTGLWLGMLLLGIIALGLLKRGKAE